MFVDVAGFTSDTQADEQGSLRRIDELHDLAQPLISAGHGRTVKSLGDGLLVEFPNARDAVECGVALQRTLQDRNANAAGRPIGTRIGIHLGDVEARGEDILGDAVNIASRLEGRSEVGGLCVSAQIFDQIRNKVPYRFSSLGPTTLKGIAEPVVAYRVELPWLDATDRADSAVPRVAVLPLTNISPDPKDEYIADGLTEELIAVLSRLRGLRVIARTSVTPYKTAPKPIRQVGVDLGVSAVLEGSVRRSGNRLRITLQLIDARTEEHRWAETFDRQLDDVFEVQAEIAERTASSLRLGLALADREALRRIPMADPEAYELCLQGIAAFERAADRGWTREGTREAERLFEAAIAKEPSSALPKAHLADLLIAAMGECLSRAEVASRATTLVAEALQADPSSAQAHVARGNLALQIESDWALAESEFRKGAELNPSSMAAHAWYGILLITLGRYAEAIRELTLASDLSPLFGNVRAWKIRATMLSGDLPGALRLAREQASRDPTSRATHVTMGQLLLAAGRVDEARHEAELGAGPIAGANLLLQRALLRLRLGDRSEAERLAAEWSQPLAEGYARLNYLSGLLIALGETERGLDLLEQDAHAGGDRSLWIDFRRSEFDPVRTHPRFLALLREYDLPTP
ncbi:MAG TPA: adenylate/guanylate cyclase domain-containing protein [Thermoplasmata archaeon]|nr:adenylate/guanylate cyclase domain-containing protein [Thermoplasmata archaeon]